MKCLKLANNLLTTFKAIRAISFHRSLRELDISNNPIISPKNGNLKVQVLQIVPSLLVLNNSSIRSRAAVQLHAKDNNIKYSSIFEKRRLMKSGLDIPELVMSPPLSPSSSPMHIRTHSREKFRKSELAFEPPTVSPGSSSQLSRFVIDASRDDTVMQVVNVEFYPRNINNANIGTASSSSPSPPNRVLNIVRSKSSDRLNDLIIAGEAAPEEIIRHSIELKTTRHSPTFEDSAVSQEQSANVSSTRVHSRLPWRNPPNPLPRPKKFEKKTRGMLELYEKNRTHIRRVSTTASTGPWSHTPFDTPPEMNRRTPTSNLSDEYASYMGQRDRRRSAGDVFREMLSFAGMEIGWDGSGDDSLREHMHQQLQQEPEEVWEAYLCPLAPKELLMINLNVNRRIVIVILRRKLSRRSKMTFLRPLRR